MNKKEITEIKRQFAPDHCTITRICGCYVDLEKEKREEFNNAFFSVPEDDAFKYFDILKKTLSGKIGRNLATLEFPTHTEQFGGQQELLMRLRRSQLKDSDALEEFYDRVVEAWQCQENYLILLVHGAYDVPGKAKDNTEMFDASDEVYEYLLCSICPVKLSKSELSYAEKAPFFQSRVRDWIVDMPHVGFLFPAFNNRGADIHSTLYYSRNAGDLHEEFVDRLLGCKAPLTSTEQKELFQVLVEEALGEKCSYSAVMGIYERINEIALENQNESDVVTVEASDVKRFFYGTGLEQDRLEHLIEFYRELAGDMDLIINNIVDAEKFEIKTPDVVINTIPEKAQLVEAGIVDGRRCLVIGIDENVEINGVTVRS